MSDRATTENLILEFFNAINHPNPGDANTTLSCSSFGKPQAPRRRASCRLASRFCSKLEGRLNEHSYANKNVVKGLGYRCVSDGAAEFWRRRPSGGKRDQGQSWGVRDRPSHADQSWL